MTTAFAVIGANWGDEGKGLAVDAMAAALSKHGQAATVVRANGGAQAGHTVFCPRLGRHVFHHLGAGTLAGAATHLSRFFVVHPMMFDREMRALDQLGAPPVRVTVDPRAPVTTPWDMAINQALEIARADGRHGSTGLGFGETLERTERGPQLVAADLWAPDLAERLASITKDWLDRRLEELGLQPDETPLGRVLSGTRSVGETFLGDCNRFTQQVQLIEDAALSVTDAVIFEGAQGLQLDMKWGEMPHVTRSRTGLANVVAVAREAGIARVDTLYMTRAYATRHGAGPLPHEPLESEPMSWLQVEDGTNIENPWQGALRFAPLDLDLMKRTIAKDLAEQASSGIEISASIGLTCLDQVEDAVMVVVEGEARAVAPSDLAGEISLHFDLPVTLTSAGPSRDHVHLAVSAAAAA